MSTVNTPKPNSALIAPIRKALLDLSMPGEVDGLRGQQRDDAVSLSASTLARRKPGEISTGLQTFATPDGRRLMRLAIANDDMPFLVDSVSAVLASHGLIIDRLLHPILSVERDSRGNLVSFGRKGAPESLIYLEVERADARQRVEIMSQLAAALADVRAAVGDWEALKAAVRADREAAAGDEAKAFIDWIADDHFTLLGHCRYDAKGGATEPLGVARSSADAILSPEARKRAVQWFREGGAAPLVVKSNLISTVHRAVPLDLVILPSGRSGLSIHAGLWTSAALGAAPDTVPILRARLAAAQATYQFDPKSHAGKALAHAFASLPHDVLVSVGEQEAAGLALAAMSIADRPRTYVEVAAAPLRRHLFAFVWLPREDLTTARRTRIGMMIEGASRATILSWSIALGDGDVALLRYTLDLRAGGTLPDAHLINRQLDRLVKGWEPAVEEALAHQGEGAMRLALRFAEGFPAAYRDGAGPEEAARDIGRLATLSEPKRRAARLYRNPGDAPNALRLKLYGLSAITLSDTVPALENFGFRVIEEQPTLIGGGALGHIHRFILELGGQGGAQGVIDRASTVEAAIAAVIEGVAENDRFNQLIVGAALDQRSVVLLRALFRYLWQTGMPYGLSNVAETLRSAPAITSGLVALFDALHNPALVGKAKPDAVSAAIDKQLASVTAIDDDRILRLYRAVIRATLRTNMFTPAAAEALAFKLDSVSVPGLPDPKPWREIFVYSPRVEGIHLRAGPIARGGLRWSDRRDDFRTEILGLMKAQRVKNAVIVPTGAKGGFYPKHLPDPAINRDAWLAEGTESYRIFIRTLLSVTDNLVAGKVVHPEGVVIRDGEDPYFVVAADKGTATFSDVANAIALERGFWLGDAFASGGSVGYDHKAMGITAKGGWVSVRRHFAEMGVDVQKEPVRVIGCGDMSGDVFGNGMLLSKAIKLVAAFDHRHIFFDPDPDPAKSWKERERMFGLPRSSWMDYNAKLISKGGGVFPRSAKTIKLSPQIRALLGVSETALEPSAIIAAILRSQADLLWFGGIGTYVKARGESNSDVGDRANDAHRVNAEEVRAKVIGEGANLGVTQAARIAFALNGGRINTDFIDNSAGVDCSDNEVNIKIALNGEVLAGKLGMKARNALLARMTDDVSALVLEDNRLQTLALSIAERDGAAGLPSQIRLIEHFETEGRLDRAVEGIASNDELSRRAADGKGLTRPELAVVMATAKLALQAEIEASDLGMDPAALADLRRAFPAEMQAKHAKAIDGHRLRNEIIATKLANRIVNRMGLIHPFELAEEEGCMLGDVAEAFVIAEQVLDIPALWAAIDSAEMPEMTRLMLFEQVAVEMRAHMADILRNSVAKRSNDKAIAAYRPTVERLAAAVDTLLPAEARRQTQAYGERLAKAGAPRKLADRLVRLAELDGAIGLSALSAKSGVDIVATTKAFTRLGESLAIDWAQGTAMQMDPSDPWERLLAAGLAREFQAMRLEFLARRGGKAPEVAVEKWITEHADRIAAFRSMINRAQRTLPSTAMLAQIAGQARGLLGR